MNRPRRTWRPIFWLWLAAVLALALIAAWPELPRQQRYIFGGMTLIAAFILSLFWFLLRAPLPVRIRIGSVVVILIFFAAGASSLRIRGVTGDLLPILEFRWKKEPLTPQSPNTVLLPQIDVTNRSHGVISSDFPQFYGPNRNAVLESPILQRNWSTHPPRLVWKQSIGAAWSAFAVVDGLAVTQEQSGADELVTCYELLTGRRVWSHSDETRFANTIAGEGPRATPTIVSNRVFTFGSTGILNCLELASGKRIWSRDTAKHREASVPEWGFSSSPLVTEGMVIVSVGGSGGSLVAYRAADGEFLWASGNGGAGYSSPIEANLCGQTQVLIFGSKSVASFDRKGAPLWEHPWPSNHPHVSLPVIVSSNLLLVSSGYGTGAELIEISQDPAGTNSLTASRVWKSIALKSKFGPIFVKDDYIFGLDDGMFTCVDLKTGQRRWKDGRYGHGQGLLVAGLILLMSESGEVILIEPDGEKLVELGRFQVFSDKTWNPPALAGEYLLLRNDQEAACVQLQVLPST